MKKLQKEKTLQFKVISSSVLKWIGILNTQKNYKELKDEHIGSMLKKDEIFKIQI